MCLEESCVPEIASDSISPPEPSPSSCSQPRPVYITSYQHFCDGTLPQYAPTQVRVCKPTLWWLRTVVKSQSQPAVYNLGESDNVNNCFLLLIQLRTYSSRYGMTWYQRANKGEFNTINTEGNQKTIGCTQGLDGAVHHMKAMGGLGLAGWTFIILLWICDLQQRELE